jgi:hypothetical protein
MMANSPGAWRRLLAFVLISSVGLVLVALSQLGGNTGSSGRVVLADGIGRHPIMGAYAQKSCRDMQIVDSLLYFGYFPSVNSTGCQERKEIDTHSDS